MGRVNRTQNGCGQAISITNVSTESYTIRGENRALHREARTQVGTAAIPTGRRTREKRKAALQIALLLLRICGGIAEDTQNRTIRDRSQSPLPVVIIGRATQWRPSPGLQQPS